MMEFKEIRLIFENCEHLDTQAYISFDTVSNEENCFKVIDNVIITIPKSENGVYTSPFDCNYETTKFNRILEHNDITQIIINSVAYYTKWYDEDEYCTSQSNEYQNTYRAEDGSVIINISTANKKQETENERILNTLKDYMEENPAMAFGKIIHMVECKLGSSIIDAKNETIIAMLEEMMMEQI